MSSILLRKARRLPRRQPPPVLGHHPREPDVALNIEIFIPIDATEQHATEHSESTQLATAQRHYAQYDAEYKGHGQSKTAFVLIAPGEPFHEMILKLVAEHDPEPEVCRAMPADVTPRILYECDGFHGDTRYHCWITEQTIPLDEFARDSAADKQQCTLGAFICVLRAAMRGLRLSDCAFFNFGVRCNDSAVVIIDAGSYGIKSNQQWSKGEVNSMTMNKFWRHAEKAQAENPQLKQLWKQHHQLQECLDAAEALWAQQPNLRHATQSVQNTAALLLLEKIKNLLPANAQALSH